METIIEQLQQALEEQDLDKVYALYHGFFDSFKKDQIEELIELAQYSMSIGFYEQAKRAYVLLTELEPEESAWTILLADLFIAEGEYDQAMSILYDIPETDKNYPSTLVMFSELYRSEGDNELAERKLLQAKELAPNEPMIDFYLGTLLFEMGAFDRSVHFLDSFLKSDHELTGEESRARDLLIEASLELGDDTPLQELIEEDGLDDSTNELLNLVAFRALQSEDYDQALEIYQQLLLREEEQLSALLGISEVYIAKRDWQEALDTLQKVTEAYPYEAYGYRLLAMVYEATGDAAHAQEAYQQAYQLAPDSMDLVQAYVTFLLEIEDFEEAEAVLNDGFEQGFDNGAFLYWMAKAQEGLEEFDKAADYYEQASQELADSVTFITDYVRFLREEGRIAQAREWLDHGFTIDPLNQSLFELQQYLND